LPKSGAEFDHVAADTLSVHRQMVKEQDHIVNVHWSP